MSIDLKHFVDINIKAHVTSQQIGTRSTVLLFAPEGTTGDPIDVTSYADALTKCAGMTTTLAYLKMYFDNGGVAARVIKNVSSASNIGTLLESVENEYICVCYAGTSANTATTYSALKTIAGSRTDVYGIDEKLILARTTTDDEASVKNFVVKYSNELGAEMTIAAYLSKINVYNADSIYDYMFTKEVINGETINDTTYVTYMSHNLNVDIKLSKDVRNCGGNCKNGDDLVNTYCRIILHQTLTNSLIDLLASKIKNSTGVAKIYTVLSQELSRYVTSGYLVTDKVWKDNDLKVVYNQKEYTIISTGTPLINGFAITILPYTDLTDADKAEHKAPPIYVVIAEEYGIRKITINGEVI